MMTMQIDVDFLGVFLADQKSSILGKRREVVVLIGKGLPCSADFTNFSTSQPMDLIGHPF